MLEMRPKQNGAQRRTSITKYESYIRNNNSTIKTFKEKKVKQSWNFTTAVTSQHWLEYSREFLTVIRW